MSAVSAEPGDRDAADRFLMHSDLLYTDPVLAGHYPELARTVYAPITDFGFLHDGDLEVIAAPMDFLGVNYYFPSRIREAEHTEPDPGRRTADDLGAAAVISDTEECTAMGWPVEAEGLTRLLTWLKSTYPSLPPVYITENGRACDDVVTPDGAVHDSLRSDYVRDHLEAVEKAIAQGVDVRGYYYWSLMDNFEWAEGYAKRFGLTYVDYSTQQRIPKDSFFWFRDLIAAHHDAAATQSNQGADPDINARSGRR